MGWCRDGGCLGEDVSPVEDVLWFLVDFVEPTGCVAGVKEDDFVLRLQGEVHGGCGAHAVSSDDETGTHGKLPCVV